MASDSSSSAFRRLLYDDSRMPKGIEITRKKRGISGASYGVGFERSQEVPHSDVESLRHLLTMTMGERAIE